MFMTSSVFLCVYMYMFVLVIVLCMYTQYVNFWPELVIGERLHTKYNSAGEAVSGGQSEERRF